MDALFFFFLPDDFNVYFFPSFNIIQ